MASVMGSVELRGLRCAATQGNPPQATLLMVDVRIELDLGRVAETDAFEDVVDLAALADSVRASVAAQPRKLLETIAVAAAGDVLARYSIVQRVTFRLTKPEPAGLDAAEEAVELTLSRASP